MAVLAVTLPVLLAICCGGLTEVAGQGKIIGAATKSFSPPPQNIEILNKAQKDLSALSDPTIAKYLPANDRVKNIRDAADIAIQAEKIRSLTNLSDNDKLQKTIADALDASNLEDGTENETTSGESR